MAEDLLAFLADGPGFLGKWPRIFVFCILGRSSRILGKIDQEFVNILGRWSRPFQRMAKDFLAFWADCPAGLFGKAADFLKLLEDDHKDLLACLRKLSRVCH